MSFPEVEDGGSSDKPNPFTHNFSDLHEIRLKNPNSLTFAYININSLRNKFEMFKEVIRNCTEVLLISETKLNASFVSSQFFLDGFTPPYRLDRTQHGGGTMLFIREDIPSKFLNVDTSISGIESLLVEMNLRSKRWYISCSYNTHLNSIQNHLVQLSQKFDLYSSKCKNFIVLGGFNEEMTNTHMEEFCSFCNFQNLIKDPTCFKNSEKPTIIDHILTNHPRCFQYSRVYKAGLSDFRRPTLTVLKVYHSKPNAKIIQYRDYKNFTDERFRRDLLRELSLQNVQRNELINLNLLP